MTTRALLAHCRPSRRGFSEPFPRRFPCHNVVAKVVLQERRAGRLYWRQSSSTPRDLGVVSVRGAVLEFVHGRRNHNPSRIMREWEWRRLLRSVQKKMGTRSMRYVALYLLFTVSIGKAAVYLKFLTMPFGSTRQLTCLRQQRLIRSPS